MNACYIIFVVYWLTSNFPVEIVQEISIVIINRLASDKQNELQRVLSFSERTLRIIEFHITYPTSHMQREKKTLSQF